MLARISDEPISPTTCLNAVADSGSGGIGCFVGVVRDTDAGLAVERLDYEAHPLAETELRFVCERAAGGELIAVAAEHRVGSLAVGDVAVVVAVSAVHRGEALRTTTELIDAIKSQVPIWKHQFFKDGTDQWVGCS